MYEVYVCMHNYASFVRSSHGSTLAVSVGRLKAAFHKRVGPFCVHTLLLRTAVLWVWLATDTTQAQGKLA